MRITSLLVRWTLLAVALAGLPSCSDGVLQPDPDIAPLVGDWTAVEFVVTNAADPDQSVDVLAEENASFTMNIQPSGQYTAILTLPGDARTTIGILEVEGSELVFNQEFPTVESSRATFSVSGDTFRFQGPTQVSFDDPDITVDAEVDVVLERD